MFTQKTSPYRPGNSNRRFTRRFFPAWASLPVRWQVWGLLVLLLPARLLAGSPPGYRLKNWTARFPLVSSAGSLRLRVMPPPTTRQEWELQLYFSVDFISPKPTLLILVLKTLVTVPLH